MDQNLQQLLGRAGAGAGGEATGVDQPTPDTSEQIHISSLALLKMLKHGKYMNIHSNSLFSIIQGNVHH
jgi:hypothetical protein